MELGRFKTRIENDSWETDITNAGKNDLFFQNIVIENDKIKGVLKMEETSTGLEAREKDFLIYKRGESFIIKTEFFVSQKPELEIKFNNQDLLIFDKESNIQIAIHNKEAYN